jgi:hypothetical protein
MKKEEQKEKKKRNHAINTSTIAICTVIVLSLFMTASTGGETEQKIEQAEKTASSELTRTIITENESKASITEVASSNGWTTIKYEGFEGAFPNDWVLFGNPTWDVDDYRPYTGNFSGWCAKGKSMGVDPASNDYLNDMNAWMVYGPFNLSDAEDARVTFYHWTKTEFGYDSFYYLASIDGENFSGWRVSGNWSLWEQTTFDLSDYCGEPQVWLAFIFQSDSNNTDNGTFLDEILLETYIPPGQTLQVSVSETPDPVTSGGTSQVTVHVTSSADGSPVQGANVTVSVTGGSITPTSGTTDSNGDFKSTYHAPTVTSTQTYTISATASKTGYNPGSGNDTITVNPNGATVVMIDPSTQTVLPEGSFTVNVTVDPAVPIAGVQFDLSFNASLISANSVTEGNLLKQGGANTYFSPGTIDNAAGTITGVAGAITKPGATVSLPGNFAAVSFTAGTTEGTSPLDLSNLIVGDVNGNLASITLNDGSVTVGPICLGDVNGDGHVNVLDMILVGQHWGETGTPGWIPEDVNKDGVIDVLDLIVIGQNWGPCL